MSDLTNIFGSMVFNESVMKSKLPKETYRSLKQTIARGDALNLDIANVVANAMKDWAVEKGATHFTHWFQPMTGVTAEKHDSFISPVSGGSIIMEFSGKELVKGEPDASSFPSGGLRATFEARGYTAWDPTSYAFIKDKVLCIPTAFCSYSGEALDQKTPLLKSMESINRQALRILRLFGNQEAKRVITTVGPEQEYFLIDKAMYEKRPDLIYCGRTLFGARPPKGQEMEDHYFGVIKPRVSAFMKELNEELWKLGVLAKTEHNEVAPAQHELAPIFSTTNIATDHNQLMMEMMKTVASRHDMVCLLHEKPFAGVNGSGKHNNWSISTDSGDNLLEPGKTPSQNAQFLLFLVAVMKAVDEHQDLLRVSIANAGNDHRLGANEAPPAIVSMFLGDELTAILDDIENGTLHEDIGESRMEIGAIVLPSIPKDTTDRNRTSPFAFTGNKFEFRMVGSSMSISAANTVLNTIVAESLGEFADLLEKSNNFTEDLNTLVLDTFKKHKRIVFNGNNYSDEWLQEAEKRGLLNLKTTVEAVPYLIREENIKLFEKHNVYTEAELHSRYEIMLENYCKTINIEALTLIDMTKKDILPSVLSFEGELAKTAVSKKTFQNSLSTEVEEKLLGNISSLATRLYKKLEVLENAMVAVRDIPNALEAANFYRQEIFMTMAEVRGAIDQLEMLVSSKHWVYPTYAEILYSVK
ncbi:MAG: glutamine synthetase III family protein [Christensenellales bacterium]